MHRSSHRVPTLSRSSFVCLAVGSVYVCLCLLALCVWWERERRVWEDWENQIAYSSHTHSLFTPQPVTAHFLPSSCLLPLLYQLALTAPPHPHPHHLLHLSLKCKFKLALLVWQRFVYNVTYKSAVVLSLLITAASLILSFSSSSLSLFLSTFLFSSHLSPTPLTLCADVCIGIIISTTVMDGSERLGETVL